jgi:raffinose/stachyose/melibiose transport system permease protein
MSRNRNIAQENETRVVGINKNAWWKYVVSALLIFIYIVPLYVLVNQSFKSVSDTSTRMQFPQAYNFENYLSILRDGTMFRAYLNSGIIAVSVIIIEIAVAAIAAYPLARNSTKMNGMISTIFMGVMIIPPLTILVGVYTFLTKIKALNTYWGMIVTLVAFGLPMAIFLYSNFIKSIPKELDEASIMDGAGILQTFYYVILPELKPITATIIILHGVAAWNEFAYSMYILQKPSMMTITLTIKKFFTGTTVDYGGACAAAVLAILPLTIVYLILQESFIQGQIDSAIKG